MSMRWRMRASRSVAPMSAISPRKATRAGPPRPRLQALLRPAGPAAAPGRGPRRLRRPPGLPAPPCRGPPQRREDAREIALGDEHLAGLRALVAGDDPAA